MKNKKMGFEHKATQINADDAEKIAIQALGFLAQDQERLSIFLSETGFNLADLSELAGTHDFLVSVLDYLLTDESLLLVFTSENSIDPELVTPARNALEGARGMVSM